MYLNYQTKKEEEFLMRSDVWSKLLFTFYKLEGELDFSCELPFIMDEATLLKLVDYFGGKTITIPSRKTLIEIATALDDLDKGVPPIIPNNYYERLKELENQDI